MPAPTSTHSAVGAVHAPSGSASGADSAVGAGHLVYSDYVCWGLLLTEEAHSLSECFAAARSRADECPAYVAYSADGGFCIACSSSTMERRRVAEPGYSIYATGCDADAPGPARAPVRRIAG
jgi:hypothetical protein